MIQKEKIRAVSWWLKWNDLSWPDEDVRDAVERRADAAAAAGVNCAIIFGAHFRWDFLPLWHNLHDLLAAIRTALHQRGIRLFDHHSAVLTHRCSSMQDVMDMRTFNKHHIPFAPSREAAAVWRFNGEALNDWRMIDIVTGKPVFLKPYTAEEFCINHPGFRRAYCEYVRRLVEQTGIDGLMSDDGFFYSGWTSCGCQWCRMKFREECGHELPAHDDLRFWGNYSCQAFLDWIAMRFRSTAEFLAEVRQTLGCDFPLMTCCSASTDYAMPKFALNYQILCRACNCIMLEMTGNSPELDGGWNTHFPEQIFHLGLARHMHSPCFGLGYGFSPDTAGFIWAFNKFLGSSSWFSTLKGRLGLPDSVTSALADDPELVSRAYNWEKDHPELFSGESDTETAVFFSRRTRDYYGMTPEDYGNDYRQCCLDLLDANITFNAVPDIPSGTGSYRILIMASVICLSDEEYDRLNRFLADGGTIIACGPLGNRGGRADIRRNPWLEQFGIQCIVEEPERPPAFPPASGMTGIVPVCRGCFRNRRVQSGQWVEISHGKGKLCWTPDRMQLKKDKISLATLIRSHSHTAAAWDWPTARDCGWRFRQFRLPDGRIILHALASEYDVQLMDEWEKQRKNPRGNHLISSIRRRNSKSAFSIRTARILQKIRIYAPLTGMEKDISAARSVITLRIPPDVFYFLLEIFP